MTDSPGATPPFLYSGFGLRIASDIELPELRAAPPTSHSAFVPDVRVHLSDLPQASGPLEVLGSFVQAGETEIRVDIPDVGSFAVRHGREIFVEPVSSASIEDVRTYLLGGVFAAIWHQRGLFPLHASAVLTPHGAVAFIGSSGAGKSTMAINLGEMGYPLLCDDVCVISRGSSGEALAWPGVNKMKVWAETLASVGRSQLGLRRVTGGDEKFHVPVQELAKDEPHELKRIYLLGKAKGPKVTFRKLFGAEAAGALISHTYRGMVLRSMGRSKQHLSRAAELAQSTEVYEFCRPWRLDGARSVCEEFERHLKDTTDLPRSASRV